MFDLVINRGKIVTSRDVLFANIGIKDGTIRVIGDTSLNGKQTIDANGKIVMPGAIDPHTHFSLPNADDFESGSISAACGGVTTYIDFAVQEREPRKSVRSEVEKLREVADKTSAVDYSFHAAVTDPGETTLEEISSIIQMGIPSIKFYLTYKRWDMDVNLGLLYDAMKEIEKHNGLAFVHAEHDQIIHYLREKYLDSRDQYNLKFHGKSRPDFTEEISMKDSIILSRETGAPLYLAHVSTAKGVELVRRAKSEGMPVYAETGLHYLFFTEEKLTEEEGGLYFMSPPLRKKKDITALWKGLEDGTIDSVISDHSPHMKRDKLQDPRFGYSKDGEEFAIPPGFTGIEERVPLIYTKGVVEGKLSLNQLVRLVSSNSAAIFGIENKGDIKVGYDADIMILDPSTESRINISDLHTNSDYTIYEGISVKGASITTLLRGDVIVKEGKYVQEEPQGEFIPRQIMEKDGISVDKIRKEDSHE